MGMISEFKEFAMKGNMLDMAVGIIMGGAFGTVIKSLIQDVIMPVIGHFSGGLDFSSKKIVLTPAEVDAAGAIVEGTGSAISYGSFINAMIAFVILAWVLFVLIKGMNKAKKAEEEEAPAAPPANEVLLAEIRDLLAKS
jgi:large conductance mechanosensitive channel